MAEEPLLDPQILKKVDVNINTSTSKQMYSFSKAKRFHSLKKTREQFFYNLPSLLDKRRAAIGYGKKSDFTAGHLKGKSECYYEIPREFELFRRYKSPQITIGHGRDIVKTIKDIVVIKTINNPGPGAYNPNKSFGSDALKFSVFGRTWDSKLAKPSTTPGPGQYTYLNINKEGKYPSSDYRNIPIGKFFTTSTRFNYKFNKNPSPDAYYLHNLDMITGKGTHFSSKYESNVAKTMISRPKDFYCAKASGVPGPGSYEIFSDFNGFTKIKPRKGNKGAKGNEKEKGREKAKTERSSRNNMTENDNEDEREKNENKEERKGNGKRNSNDDNKNEKRTEGYQTGRQSQLQSKKESEKNSRGVSGQQSEKNQENIQSGMNNENEEFAEEVEEEMP